MSGAYDPPDEGSSSEDDEDTEQENQETSSSHTDGIFIADPQQQQQQQEQLTVQLVLRVHAANLPRYGIRKLWPDTYVDVHLVTADRADTSMPTSDAAQYQDSFSSIAHGSTSSFESTSHTLVQKSIGRTEIIYRDTHPQYITTFPLSYVYGSKSYLTIDIFRLTYSGDREPLRIGSVMCEVGDVLGSKHRTKVKRLRSGGVIFCRLEMAEQQQQQQCSLVNQDRSIQPSSSIDSAGRFQVQFRASDLKFGKRHRSPRAMLGRQPDTILQIQKRHPNAIQQAWITVYRSCPVYESTSPTFDEGEIDLGCLCNGDLDRPIRIGIWCLKKRSKDILVGICETTVKSILEGGAAHQQQQSTNGASVYHSFRLSRSMQKNKDVGSIDVMAARLLDSYTQEPLGALFDSVTAGIAAGASDHQENGQPRHGITDENPSNMIPMAMPPPVTFQEFMNACPFQLDLQVAIDFTSSNGDPRRPGTLHEQSTEHLNDYEETIQAVAGAMIDHCQSVTVHGFGAKYGGATRHIFRCGSSPINPKGDGIDGILRAYRSVFETDLVMSGPTVYVQVLQAAAVSARKAQSSSQYTILVLITDGLAQNMGEMRRKLQVYSSVPLSVIIVGVGRADFAGMYSLCQTIGNSTSRLNVSFVEFRRHQHDPFSLGVAALQDLPTHIQMYMEQNGIRPRR